MSYYFYDQNDQYRSFDNITECRKEAKADGTVGKFRDTLGGEYYL